MSETRSQVIQLSQGTRVEFFQAKLLVERGPDEGKELLLKDQPVILGRGTTADFRLKDQTASREHAMLQPVDGGWRLRDLGSKSGSRINGIQVESAVLESGQRIRLGATELVFKIKSTGLLAQLNPEPGFAGLIGSSDPMRRLFGLIQKLAPLELPVLLEGESGTGKESLAKSIHEHSPLREEPYVVVDCTLLGEGEHLRSELFGHTKGAFTGADKDREGAFVRAHGGTLFLDEIGELPLDLQPQLLRVLEEGEVRPLGGEAVSRVRVRVVSATNRDLKQEVAEGRFRRDLYYRLSALTLSVPPLRDRGEDIYAIAESLLPPGLELSPEARVAMAGYAWPGNVRELRNLLLRAGALAEGGLVRPADLRLDELMAEDFAPASTPDPTASKAVMSSTASPNANDPELAPGSMASIEKQAIEVALRRFQGNRNQAAQHLGMSRATLFRRLKKYGIE